MLNDSIGASKRFIDEAGAHSEKYYFYHTDIRGSTTNDLNPKNFVNRNVSHNMIK